MIDFKFLKKNMTIFMCLIISIAMLLAFNGEIESKKALTSIELADNDIEIGKLVINEIVTSNKGAYIDEYGESYDYIELYNGTEKDIDLLNYGLSDRDDGKIKWLFPKITIEKKSYLVVYLTGEKKEGLYASFALKEEGGELVTLKKSNGKVLDSIRTLEMEKNHSMSRNYYGVWIVTDALTPGYANNEEGRQEFMSASKPLNNDGLVISEVLPSNEGNVSFNNKLYSYVEITNESDKDINLIDYYLTNDEKTLFKWRFPNDIIKAHSSYIVFTNKLDSLNNASFELSHKVGKVLLTRHDGIVDKVEYDELENGLAYVKYEDRWRQTADISPGYPNTTEGKIDFQKEYNQKKDDLIINEVMSSNMTYLPQNGNQFYDWIEIYNNSSNEINLSNYYLTIDKDDKKMYKLPDYTIKPDEYYILMASGDTTLSNSSYEHTNFRLSSAKGLLLYKEDLLIDSMFIHSIPRGSSYGRGIEEGFFYFQTPTPGSSNDENGIRQLSINPEFSKSGGIYNDVSSLEITIEGLGDIYYTTDGSTPSEKSTKYTGPITIDKTSVIRAVSIENQKVNSNIITNSYIVNENHTLPVVSVSLEEENYNRIINDPWANEIVKSHVEFYEESSSFSIDSGIKVFGGESRNYKKKNFALKFNKEYGGSLHYKVFDNKELVEFNDLVLRGGTQEQNYSMIRDEFVSLIAVNYSEVDAQSVKPAVLYINGKYQGIFFIREKINNNFILNNHNISGTTDIINPAHNRLENGSMDVFDNLRNYVKNHDMTDDDNYNYVSTILDIDNYIDYYIFEYILCNYDWHNVRMYSNKNLDNGKIKMILYDSDFGLKTNGGTYYFDFIQHPWLSWDLQPNVVLDGLFKNEKFKKRFVERISYFMKNVWTEENINKTYDYLYNSIYTEMERESKRWGRSYSNWKDQVVRVKEIALLRNRDVPKFTKDYFGLSTKEYNEYFG